MPGPEFGNAGLEAVDNFMDRLEEQWEQSLGDTLGEHGNTIRELRLYSDIPPISNPVMTNAEHRRIPCPPLFSNCVCTQKVTTWNYDVRLSVEIFLFVQQRQPNGTLVPLLPLVKIGEGAWNFTVFGEMEFGPMEMECPDYVPGPPNTDSYASLPPEEAVALLAANHMSTFFTVPGKITRSVFEYYEPTEIIIQDDAADCPPEVRVPSFNKKVALDPFKETQVDWEKVYDHIRDELGNYMLQHLHRLKKAKVPLGQRVRARAAGNKKSRR